MTEIRITSEKDAFDLIKKAINDEIGDNLNIIFDGWPKLTIILEGSEYASTMTPSIMESLVEFQRGLNRTYVKLVYDEDDVRRLTAVEKQDLEFKAKVENGCTKINVDLQQFLRETVDKLMTKVDGKQVVVLCIVGMSLWVADSAIKSYFDAEVKTKTVQEETIKATTLSQEETARMKILAQAVTNNSSLAAIQKDASNTTLNLLNGVSDADSIAVNGIHLNKQDAKVLARSPRVASTDIQANGNYYIQQVDTSHPDFTKIRVHWIEGNREFTARFMDQSLDQSQIKLLQEAEWSKPKKRVYLSVNATELRNQITTATIISVSPQKEEI